MKKIIIMFSLTMLACFIAEAGQDYSLEKIKQLPYSETRGVVLEKYTKIECIGGKQFAIIVIASGAASVSVSMEQVYENGKSALVAAECNNTKEVKRIADKIKKVLK